MSDPLQQRLAARFGQAERTMQKGGTTLTYIPAPEVITRLNDCFGVCGWSFEVISTTPFGEHANGGPVSIVAHVRITVHPTGTDTARYDGMGGQIVNRKRDGTILDIGDDFKGACSDAMKKACQPLGIGLYLARDESLVAADEQAQQAAEQLGGWSSEAQKAEMHKNFADAAKKETPEVQAQLKALRAEMKLPWPMNYDQFSAFMGRVNEILEARKGAVQEEFGSADEITPDQLVG